MTKGAALFLASLRQLLFRFAQHSQLFPQRIGRVDVVLLVLETEA